MNWGWSIAVVFIGFVIMVVSMVVISSMKNVNLVERDYYKQEINYQDHIEKLKNTRALAERFNTVYDQDSDQLKIHLKRHSGTSINGEVHFFRPSDRDFDVKTPLKLNDKGIQFIDLKGLKKGLWVAKLNWSIDNVRYFKRINLDIK